ncbi:MAG: 3-hydroxyacyl-[acyl-carrier-protein] dehydratase FabZ, partial [Rhodospirillales bacterium]
MTEAANTGKTIDINRIVQMIPHRYPFLLVDRVVDLLPDESATGIK